MDLRIAPATLDVLPFIAHLRNERLDNLPFAQELYLELMVKKGAYHAVLLKENCVGYAVINQDRTLLEYYLMAELHDRAEDIFGLVRQELGIKKAQCLSFDSLLSPVCRALHARATDTGFSFRTYTPHPGPAPLPGVTDRPAAEHDLPALLKINDRSFVTGSEMREAVTAGTLTVFHRGNDPVGCGLCQQVIRTRPHYDVGMLVNPAFRRQGYGTHIIRHLAGRCLERGDIPVAGCAADNVASKKTLEKAGFTADHRLYEYTLHD